MSITTMTSKEFNRNTSKAKHAEYERITNTNKNGTIVDLLAMPNAEDIDFEAPRIDKPLYQPADLP